ncbi:hypothetical protein PCH_Pc18g06420 [Penicillium rubens Wisconsin 54-1255]|uniref:Uncharacterized protein n=1 Tax=Penicillium rubens (strain ATCC 28089 / DSM 1075 / NRRL 1951 / Wisconsin 54-1255) TaxID=500485 RepID=B6HCN8_PENRW|nr:hypothetical protein PCH_Pc18g06420 [Penicillium rubens Wisconsin 54-1255]
MEVPTVMPRNPCCVAGMSWPVLLQYYKELGRALQRMRNATHRQRGKCEGRQHSYEANGARWRDQGEELGSRLDVFVMDAGGGGSEWWEAKDKRREAPRADSAETQVACGGIDEKEKKEISKGAGVPHCRQTPRHEFTSVRIKGDVKQVKVRKVRCRQKYSATASTAKSRTISRTELYKEPRPTWQESLRQLPDLPGREESGL